MATRALPICSNYFLALHKLKISVLDSLKTRRMPPRRLVANLSQSISPTGSITCATQTKSMIEKGDGMQNSAKIEDLVDDPNRLEVMTVKEIRSVMKDAGIPVQGSKRELLSTLRSYLNTNGPVEEVASLAEVLGKKNKSRKRKTPASSSAGDVSIPDTTESKQKRTRSQTQSSPNIKFTKNIRRETELSVESEGAGSKKSPSTTKSALKIEDSGESLATEPWTILTHKKPQPGWIPYNPKILRPPPLANNLKFVKLMSWNVNGLRALLKSDAFSLLQQKEDFDVLCLQETKMQEKDVDAIKSLFDGYGNSYWTCSTTKLGYSGTAIISRIKPISVSYGLGNMDHDGEGRLVTAEFDNFYLLSGYVPNSGDGLRRLSYRINEWDPSLSNYMKDLEKSKPVILTGDLNCAHEEIDIYNPAGNRRSAGFTDEERESFNRNFLARSFVDTFRKQHPSVIGYTYYGYRHGGRKTNKGWRLDYFLVSESIAHQVHDSYIVPEIGGSDHCPIGLILTV